MSDDRPVLQVVRGDATPAELAALVAVLTARAAAAAATGPGGSASGWTRRSDLVRRPFHPGPDAWRAAFR